MYNILLLTLVSVIPLPSSIPDVHADVAVLTTIEYEDSRIEWKLVLKDWIDKEETHVIRCSRYMCSPNDPQTGPFFIGRNFVYNERLKRYEMYVRDPYNNDTIVRLLVRSLEEDVTDCDPDPDAYGDEGGWVDPCTGEWHDGFEALPYHSYRNDIFYRAIYEHKQRLDRKKK